MEQKVKSSEKESYISPDIVSIYIETEQNILASGSVPDMPGEDW